MSFNLKYFTIPYDLTEAGIKQVWVFNKLVEKKLSWLVTKMTMVRPFLDFLGIPLTIPHNFGQKVEKNDKVTISPMNFISGVYDLDSAEQIVASNTWTVQNEFI